MIKITEPAERIVTAKLINDQPVKVTTDAFKLIEVKISLENKWIKATWQRHDSSNDTGALIQSVISIPFRGSRLKRILTAQNNTGRDALKTLRTVLDKALVHYGDFPEVGITLDSMIAEDPSLPDELDGYGDDLPDEG